METDKKKTFVVSTKRTIIRRYRVVVAREEESPWDVWRRTQGSSSWLISEQYGEEEPVSADLIKES